MKLRARWIGPAPRKGDYLASTTRPRFAYRVKDVTTINSIVNWDHESKAESRRLTIVVDRIPIGAVPKHARLHPWRWDKRAALSK